MGQWTCIFCGKFHDDNLKYKYCNCNENKMTAENYALELLEKFSTRKDALIALDMCTTIMMAVHGEGSWLDRIEETKVFLLKRKNYIPQ